MNKIFKIQLIILFNLCLLSGISQEQQYQPIFGDEVTQWIATNRSIISEDAWMDTISVIATENEYRILEFRSKWSGYNQLIGKIRTNETNSKLYFIEQDSITELLIMDLDLAVGDSFNLKTDYYQVSCIIGCEHDFLTYPIFLCLRCSFVHPIF